MERVQRSLNEIQELRLRKKKDERREKNQRKEKKYRRVNANEIRMSMQTDEEETNEKNFFFFLDYK